MPNYVMNMISFDGSKEEIDKLIEKIKGNNVSLDFNKISKVPKKYSKNYFEEEKWKIENWGTKWNAMDINIIDNDYYFTTAWNPPLVLMKKLSKQFPKVEINIEWAEETGYDIGYITFKNGREIAVSELTKDEEMQYFEKLWGTMLNSFEEV